MNLSNSPIMQLTRAKMQYLGQRQAVLALNVANVDTAGYKARDIKTPDFEAMVSGSSKLAHGQMMRTNPMHMLGGNSDGAFKVTERATLDERNPNDNRVNIDDEIQEVALNQSEYNKAIGIYRKNVSLYRIALGNQNAG